jgi:hypothetical protein
MAFLYSVYGLTLASNFPIPGLLPLQSETLVDVDITFGGFDGEIICEQPWYVSTCLDEDSPILTVWKSLDGSWFRFLYSDRTEFRINRAGTKVSATWPESLSLENTTIYLVGQIAAFVLRLRGFVCLHASSIVVDQRLLAIVGNSGAGKSTTAASLVKRGHRVLSEDVSALVESNGKFMVQPGYPRVNLWPDAVHSLYGAPDALPQIVSTWDKRYFDLGRNGGNFFNQPAALSAIYVLEDRVSEETAPSVESVSAREALISLLTNAHGRHLVERSMRTREFDLLSRVAEVVPVRRVVPHIDFVRLDELCERILHDFRHTPEFTRL